MIDDIVREDLFIVTLDRDLELKQVTCMEKSISERGKTQCQNPEARACLTFSRNSKETWVS